MLKNLGAVAQLAERLHGMQEVRGSIPLSSTTCYAARVFCFCTLSLSEREPVLSNKEIGKWTLQCLSRFDLIGFWQARPLAQQRRM